MHDKRVFGPLHISHDAVQPTCSTGLRVAYKRGSHERNTRLCSRSKLKRAHALRIYARGRDSEYFSWLALDRKAVRGNGPRPSNRRAGGVSGGC